MFEVSPNRTLTTLAPTHRSTMTTKGALTPEQPPLLTHGISALVKLPSPFPAPRRLYAAQVPRDAPECEVGAPGFYLFPSLVKELVPSIIEGINACPVEWEDYGPRQSKNYGPVYHHHRKRYLFEQKPRPEYPLPDYAVHLVLPKILELLPILQEWTPNQLSTTRYPIPGNSFIPRHNDCQNGDIRTAVVGVCVASDCKLSMYLPARYTADGLEVRSEVNLPNGSVYIMSGDSLRAWEHSILSGDTKQTRYSLTFRDVRPRVENGTDAEYGSIE